MKGITQRVNNGLRGARLNAHKIVAVTIAATLLSAGLLIGARANADDFEAQSLGSLDTTFGSGGKVMTDLFGAEDDPDAMALQPDGKIIVVGGSFAAGVYGISLIRCNKDGSLDLSFGNGGKVYTSINKSGAGANAVGLQLDGKIVVAGSAPGSSANTSDFAVVRYKPDGSLDPTFGAGGIVTTDFFGFFDNATSLAIQNDGRIVVAGIVYHDANNGSSDFGLARYNTDGSLDATFGNGGKVRTDFFGKSDSAQEITIQANGRLVVAGSATDASNNRAFAVTRYNADGSLDASFGAGGRVTTKFAGTPEISDAYSVAIQPDGKIVVAGSSSFPFPSPFDFALVRYNTDGSLDTSFGEAGKVLTDFFGKTDLLYSVLIQSDGKIVTAGSTQHTSSGDSNDFALARYNTNGTLDSTFGIGGKVITDFLGDPDGAVSAAIQSDGNIVVAGFAYHANDDSSANFGLARYVGDSPLPPAARLPVVQNAQIQGKKLIVTGLNYDISAVIFMDGAKQKTANDDQQPENVLIARKAGKYIAPGQTVTIQVQNTDGKMSNPFTFTRAVE